MVFLSITTFLFSQNKTGCISGNCKDGKGTYVFNDGSLYVGEFVNGNMEGFGKLTDKFGNIYTGYFKNNKFNGIGKFERTDGTKYIGEFKDGRRHGLGTQYYSATYKEKGKWDNDRFIEEANFEDFVVEEPYSFCQALTSIINAATNNFESIKGERINALIPDEYHCNIQLKELSTVSIHSKNGYSGIYFKGTSQDALIKLEELKSLLNDCLQKSCFKTFLSTNQTNEIKQYEYIILSTTDNCDANLAGVKIIIKATIEKSAGSVVLKIIPKP
jgi:hypothetical protein